MREIAAAAVVLALSAALAYGRAGGGDSYSGGGDSFSSNSGGGDSSFSSDHDLGSGSRSHGGSGGGGADGCGPLMFFLIGGGLWVGFFSLILYTQRKDRLRRRQDPVAVLAKRPADALLKRGLAGLKQLDPAFDPGAFLERAKRAFLAVQKAWSDGDMAPARAFVSDGIMERFTILLDQQRGDGIRNLMDQVRVIEARILQASAGPRCHALHVSFHASAVDQYFSIKTRERVRGLPTPQEFVEVWSFLRRPGAKTLQRPGLIEGACPNCGAALELADAARCSSCGNWVNSGEYDWVLSEITQSCEWAARHDCGMQGFDALAESDPWLDAQFLEDRASVAFWRWQQALRLGDPAPLRCVATEAFCRGFSAEPAEKRRHYRDPAVGCVEVLAFETAGGREYCHAMVRWSGREHRASAGPRTPGIQVLCEHVFVLERRQGVKTDMRAGLSSLRCASCGAPPSQRDAAACGQCGTPFNDGSRGWVLSRMVSLHDWSAPTQAPRATGRSRLSPAAALWFLASAMLADGRKDAKEMALLRLFARRRGVPGEELRAVLEAAEARRIEFGPPKSSEEAGELLEGMITLCLIDGELSEPEERLLVAFGGKLNVSAEMVLALARRKREEFRRRLTASAQ
ncbi:MAG: TIM44-like domain-containing protein [Elusimicrobiota bacterium]